MTVGAVRSVRVVKVGGSLFDLPDLPQRLRACLSDPPHPGPTVLLAGGGELCDAVRCLDRRYELGEAAAHELCVTLLDVTARLLSRLLPEADFLDDWADLHAWLPRHPAGVGIFAPASFLERVEPQISGEPLGRDWQTTTDSIAARLAEALGGGLLLLKSADPPAATLDELAEAGFVDGRFPAAAANLPRVGLRNLRNPRFEQAFREIRRMRAC